MYMFLNLIFVWFSFSFLTNLLPPLKKGVITPKCELGIWAKRIGLLLTFTHLPEIMLVDFGPLFSLFFFSVSPAYSLICSHQLQIISFQSFLLLSVSSSVESVFTCLRRAFLPLLLPVSENWSYIQQYADDNLCGAQHKREHEHERARRDRGRVGVCSNNTVLY